MTSPLPLDSTFENAFRTEVLRSERLRITVLAAILVFAAMSFVTLTTLSPEILEKVFRGQVTRSGVIIAVAILVCYLLAVRYAYGRYLAAGTEPPVAVPYLVGFVETSMPALVILAGSYVIGPVYVLVSPPVYFFFVFILLAPLRMDFLFCAFTGAVAAVEYLSLAAYFLGQVAPGDAALYEPFLVAFPQHIGKAMVFLGGGVIAGLVAIEIQRRFMNTFRMIEERNRVIHMFGQHVSPAVVDKLLGQKRDVSEVRHVCVMFFDIRDFTSFCERRTPEQVVDFLNVLFDVAIDIVNDHNGIINKFLGDGFMAVFGAPLSDGRDSANAVAAGLEIIEKIDQLVASGKTEAVRVGIGLHTGPAVTGHVGSSKRKEYTIIGDVVNLASRLEGQNKTFGSRLLISGEVWEAVGKNVPGAIPRGPVTVKGRETPVEVIQLA